MWFSFRIPKSVTLKYGSIILVHPSVSFSILSVEKTWKNKQFFTISVCFMLPELLNKVLCYKIRSMPWKKKWMSYETYTLSRNYAWYRGISLQIIRENLQDPSSRIKYPWPLKFGPMVRPEMSIKIYHYPLSNILEERRSHLLRGWRLKSRSKCHICNVKWQGRAVTGE
jgi:hypothetical protein